MAFSLYRGPARPRRYPIANTDTQATSIAIQPDGKIVVGGYGNGKLIFERFNTNGTLDSAFGTAGVFVAPTIGTGSDTLTGIALDSSGNIVASGTAGGIVLGARVTPSGALDTSFNGAGYATTDVFPGVGSSAGNAVTVESNGDIAISGSGDGPDTYSQLVIVEYTSSGALDTTFNGTGIFTHEFTSGGNPVDASANAIRVNSAGNFVTAGFSGPFANDDFNLAIVDPPSTGSSSTTTSSVSSSLDPTAIFQTADPGLSTSTTIALPPSNASLPASAVDALAAASLEGSWAWANTGTATDDALLLGGSSAAPATNELDNFFAAFAEEWN